MPGSYGSPVYGIVGPVTVSNSGRGFVEFRKPYIGYQGPCAPQYFTEYPPQVEKVTPQGKKIYIAGSLANPEIVKVTIALQEAGHIPFSEWYTPGPEADVLWRDYEQSIGFSYREALKRPSAVNTFQFDKRNIDDSDMMLMVLPCGKSAHLELGYIIGQGKPGHILMTSEPEKWDVMYQFATGIHYNLQEFLDDIA